MNRKTQKKFIYFLFFIALISNAFPVWSAPYNYEEQRDSEEDYWSNIENPTDRKQENSGYFIIIFTLLFWGWIGYGVIKDWDKYQPDWKKRKR